MHSLALACVLCVACLLAGLMALAVYTRRGEARPDAPGVRTVARFRGGLALCAEPDRTRTEQPGPGEGVLRAIVARLAAAGAVTGEVDEDDSGWAARIEHAGEKAYLLLGMREEDEWLLFVIDPSSGGPGPREVLPLLDEALNEIDELEDIAWHARNDIEGAGSEDPIDA